ncbi:MAG: NUDIX hydrolase, partial [Patescibacteria group bacterium]|nr:NUDIX hydrolase [Patescibacteria group bacterium]
TWSYCVKSPFVLVLVLQGNRLVLVRQNRYPERQPTWEVVKGGIERGESPLAAARRELKEETGFYAKRFLRIGRLVVAPGYFNQPGIVYVAKQLTPGVSHPEANGEILEVMRASPARIRQMIAHGDLYDSTTFAGLLMARKFFPV